MAKLDEVPDGVASTLLVVDAGRVQAGLVDAEHPHWNAEFAQRARLAVGEHQAGDDDRVHALAYRHPGEEALPSLLVAQVVEQ